jgi:glyoxylate/hydroxypyruvate reductase A
MATLAYKLPQPWLEAIVAAGPHLDIRTDIAAADAASVKSIVYAWTPPPAFEAYPNLRLLQAVGAGVDRLIMNDNIPHGIQISRVVDESQPESMSEYIALHVLRHHHRLDYLQCEFAARRWEFGVRDPARTCTVGILGLGRLGSDAARKLAMLGFRVRGWSRAPKQIDGITTFSGRDQLDAFLSECRHLVCLLPLTPHTAGILNRRLFEALPKGAFLINVGRGEHLVEEDLIPALDSGRLAGATIDVMRQEPVPASHPFWSDPRILITPHSASVMYPSDAAPQIIANLERVEKGETPANLIDRMLGY